MISTSTIETKDSGEFYTFPEIRFERATDLELVRSIMTRPEIYRWITDDLSPEVDMFQPIDHPSVWYVLVFDGEELLGLWCFYPENSVCWDIHTTLLPEALRVRGRSVAAAQKLGAWLWENTPFQRVITKVPDFNRLALRLAKQAGMVEFGVNAKSFLKNGVLHDQILLGISRPEGTCLLQQ